VEGLRGFPNLGRSVPEADREDIREIIFQGYRIIYQTTADHLLVLTVLHGSRDLSGDRQPALGGIASNMETGSTRTTTQARSKSKSS